MGNEQSTTGKPPDQAKKQQRRVATKFIKQLTSKKPSDLVDEFKQLSLYKPSFKDAPHPKQVIKNRYRDIECYEPSRVILKGRPNDEDYIHANWVTAGKFRYICTQAPLGHTIDDFWFMVATENVGSIIMLCDLVEDGQRKCAEYWPHEDGERVQHGDVIVENVSVGHSTLPRVQVTILKVIYNKKSHLLNHYQWLGWPDDGVPDDHVLPYKLLDIAKDCVKQLKDDQTPDPIVVHCSAGVGRTGTLVGLDIARTKLNAGISINVQKIVKELRDQRPHSIQGPLQYIYLNACILQCCMELASMVETVSAHKWLEKCQNFLFEQKEKTRND